MSTVLGLNALQYAQGGNCTAIGQSSLQQNSSGYNNTSVGYFSNANNTTGNNNTSVGNVCLINSTAGCGNTAMGHSAQSTSTTGNYNTAVGFSSLASTTGAGCNTAVGTYSLYNNTSYSYSTGIGYAANVTGHYQIQLGDSTTTTYVYGTVQNRSDLRDKADVRDTTLGLKFINELRPVDYRWDMREEYKAELPIEQIVPEDATEEQKAEIEAKNKATKDAWLVSNTLGNLHHDGSKKRKRFHHGLIAQEVKAVIEKTGVDFGGFQDHTYTDGEDVLSIGYDELIAPLIKAVQELTAKVKKLEAHHHHEK